MYLTCNGLWAFLWYNFEKINQETIRQINLFQTNVAFLYTLKISENQNIGLRWLNPLSVNPTKWSNWTNCLSVSDHFLGFALKGLISIPLQERFIYETKYSRMGQAFFFLQVIFHKFYSFYNTLLHI